MVTSFADGTKIAFEQAIVANATGMGVSQRGMIGHHVKGHIDTLTTFYDPDQLREWGGIVDYVLEADPGPGVYVIGYTDDPRQRHDLEYLKKGPGPLYSFYVPYHLCSLEVPISVARVALFQDVVIAPLAGPVVDVVTTAKRDLKAGEILDGIGGYLAYGQCENADLVQAQRLLPMGLSEGCRLKRNIAKDAVITYADVNLPAGRLCDRLRSEQDVQFFDVKQLAVALSDHRP
jgi:predicted homoserine dehydrogenase-like protein